MEESDEIEKYYNYSWIRNSIQDPPVERLGFRLLNEQNIYFEDLYQLDVILALQEK